MRPILTIDLGAVVENWRALDRFGAAETAAVVKADAYGLGVEAVAPALWRAGARTFFVATGREATTLRAVLDACDEPNGVDTAIYVLNGPQEGIEDIVAARARPVLSAWSDVEAALAHAAAADVAPLKAALQIETGMNRLGLSPSEQNQVLSAARDGALSGLEIDLLVSHFAAADEPESDLTEIQAAAFAEATPRFRQAFPSARTSLSATGGTVLSTDHHFDLVRAGVGLYGGAPFLEARPVVRLDAPILRVWEVATGERSGYGGTWTAARPSRLATIPVGYADGFPRSLSGRGEAIVKGRLVPFAGRVSMDLIVLDVTDAGPVAAGERATLLDATLTVDRVASNAGTIGYEILTSLGRRYDRRYTDGD